jgi:hypothetical protein
MLFWLKTSLSTLKGSNYYKHVEKAYNFRIKSEPGKWSMKKKFYGYLYFEEIFTVNPIS